MSQNLRLTPNAPPPAEVGGLRVETLGLAETARAFVEYCRSPEREAAGRPLFSSSTNGQIISLCARNPEVKALFQKFDSVNADGQPMVVLSRLLSSNPLPERVATTDLFPAVAALAEAAGLSFYILGASERVNAKAVELTQQAYPGLRIVGRRHGYFSSPDDESAACDEIAALQPDILWVSMGAPLEQEFGLRNLEKFKGVGIVKTAGGLLDFMSLEKPRAPMWMQRCGLEWLFRTLVEPRRLLMRYLTTNPHAVMVMLATMR